MSRRRRQQRKRMRNWSLVIRETMFGWRAWWLFKGERFDKNGCSIRAYFFPKGWRYTAKYDQPWSDGGAF